jgi:stress-induced morphogen
MRCWGKTMQNNDEQIYKIIREEFGLDAQIDFIEDYDNIVICVCSSKFNDMTVSKRHEYLNSIIKKAEHPNMRVPICVALPQRPAIQKDNSVEDPH